MTLREAVLCLSVVSASSVGSAICADLQVGLADYQLEPGVNPPAAAALFRLVNPQGVLVSEAGVETAPLLRRGCIFVQQSASWRTGLALANPAEGTVTLRLILRNAAGVEFARRDELALSSHQHLAMFVDELFDSVPAAFTGSLSFEGRLDSDVVAAVTLRQSTNGHGEPLFATLPVASLDQTGAGGDPPDFLVLPQVGAGSSLSTQLLLMSRSNVPARGTIRLTASDGSPLIVHSAGGIGAQIPFELPAHGVQFFQLTAPAGTDVAVGYAEVDVTEGELPTGTAIFQYFDAAGTISEAGVGAIAPTRKARIFVDADQTSTGLALVNPGSTDASVTFRLLDGNGFLLQEVQRSLPAGNHLAKFTSELFELPPRFAGLLEIEGDTDLVLITLKLTTNSRGEPILTTLPTADLIDPLQGSRLIFPQIGAGAAAGVGQFSTRLIFIGPQQEKPSTGRMRLWKGAGMPLRLDRISNDFAFGVEAGAAGQIRFNDEPLPVVVTRGVHTSAFIGLEGGSLILEDDQENLILLDIPPFALQTATTITMTAMKQKATRTLGETPFPGVVLEPEGLVLLEPARLYVVTADPLSHPERTRIHTIDIDGVPQLLPEPLSAGQVVAGNLHHFSEFTVEEGNLSDLFMAAEAIYGMTDAASRERARRIYEEKFGLSLPQHLVELLVRMGDIETLKRYYGDLDLLGVDVGDSGLGGWLEELALTILSQPIPGDPCGLYQAIMNRTLSMIPALGDPALETDLRSRIAQVDSRCISESLVGDWLEDANWQSEICLYRAGGEETEMEEEDQAEAYRFRIVQSGSRLSITYPDFPGDPTFTGWVRKTSSTSQPYRITASTAGADSLDCLTFFASGGYELEFGAPLCPSNAGCLPLSCAEHQTVGANQQSGGGRLVGVERWTFAASALVFPRNGASYIASVSCLGQGPFSAVKLP